MKKHWIILILVAFIGLSSQCKKEEEEEIPDTTPPVITLLGSNPLTVDKGTTFVDPGATATDNKDGDISKNIQVDGTVDTSVEASYFLKYQVSDAAGNKAVEQTREVQVMVF